MIPVRDAIVTAISNASLGFRSVEGHDGEFDAAEIQRHFGHGNAARVVALGAPEFTTQADLPVARSSWGVFVAAQSRTAAHAEGQSSAGDAALALATKVSALVMNRGQTWDGTALRAPEGVKMQNLYAGKLSKRGIGLWVVRWDQLVAIDERMVTSLDALELIHTDYELSDNVDGPEFETDTEFT